MMNVYNLGELHSLETADGEVLTLSHNVHFITTGGYGMPPISFQTRRGYKQDGVTEVDYTLQSRTIKVSFYQKGVDLRLTYWDNRADAAGLPAPQSRRSIDPDLAATR